MNKYERLFAWTTVAVLMLFTIGTCQKYDTHSDTEKDKRIAELEFKFDSLQSVKTEHHDKVVQIDSARTEVKKEYSKKKSQAKKFTPEQHDSVFEVVFEGRKDSANMTFLHNEQCQKELAMCDSASKHKDTINAIQEAQISVLDSTANIHKADAAHQKKMREDDAYKLYLWRKIGVGLIVTDVLAILTIMAIR